MRGGCAGEFIGYFEILDTGAGIDTDGDGRGDSIKRGKSIDVYRPSLQECRDWIATYGDYVYILKDAGDWLYVRYGSTRGYVSKNYISYN